MWVKKIVPAKICYMMTQSDLDLFFEAPFLFALLASLSCDAFPPDSVFACCGARGLVGDVVTLGIGRSRNAAFPIGVTYDNHEAEESQTAVIAKELHCAVQ